MCMVRVALCMGLLGCGPGRADCEHAKQVYWRMGHAQMDHAVETTKMGTKADEIAASRNKADKKLERAAANYVDECMGLGWTGRSCIQNIDALEKILAARTAAYDACEKGDPGARSPCLDGARKGAEIEADGCLKLLEELAKDAYKAG